MPALDDVVIAAAGGGTLAARLARAGAKAVAIR